MTFFKRYSVMLCKIKNYDKNNLIFRFFFAIYLKNMETEMEFDEKSNMSGKDIDSSIMPVLFVGHGNPMNAIQDNEITHGWQKVSSSIPKPKAILCISAHWETNGMFVTAAQNPKTIHDFYGFPKELFDVEYPAPGNPELASETISMLQPNIAKPDLKWGIDHGCWSVLRHFYPYADIPIVQLSLDYSKTPEMHYEIAKELKPLREKGVLIIGSGNLVHNLGLVNWQNEQTYDWAIEANDKIKKKIIDGNHKELISYKELGNDVKLAIPTPEHFLPLLYVLGLKNEQEKISFFNEKIELGSISMTSVRIGN